MLALFVITSPGLEPLTRAEIASLGLEVTAEEAGGLQLTGTPTDVFLLNLHLRTASRVLVRLGQFRARTFPELERKAALLPWQGVLGDRGVARFRVTSRKSRLYHQAGIAERIARVAGVEVRSWAEESEADGAQGFVIRVHRDEVTVSADASGALLHQRGYRLETAKAPLRETIAAAMLLSSGYDGSQPLADPFAGSGTIPIEAAMIARRIAPGVGRPFACESWPIMSGTPCEGLREAARGQRVSASCPIIASDRDEGATRIIESNAGRAGVASSITIRQAAISDLRLGSSSGLIATNPPYGKRVGRADAVGRLHHASARVFHERAVGWRVVWLAPSAPPSFGGDRWAPSFRVSNGGISVAAWTRTGSPDPAVSLAGAERSAED